MSKSYTSCTLHPTPILLDVNPEATPGKVAKFLGVTLGNHISFHKNLFSVKLPDLECNEDGGDVT